ncbi:MAG: SLC13 family permease [Thermoanaerobaculia bacterium]
MTVEILLVLGLLGAALAFFFFEWLPVDVVTLVVLALLVLTGLLTPAEAFSGFANEIIVILASIFVLAGALVRTGVLEWLAESIHRVAGRSDKGTLTALMVLSAVLSAFVSNTSSTAVLLPPTLEIARRSSTSPSRFLMPLAFASMLGGTCTLIGTSTNVAASGMVERMGLGGFSLFEFAPVGLVAVAVGILYMLFIGNRLVPVRETVGLSKKYEIEKYLSAIVVHEGSELVGKTLRQARLGPQGLNVLGLVRNEERMIAGPFTRLEAEDMMIVQATREAILRAKENPALRLEADTLPDDAEFAEEGVELVEAILMPGSGLAGRTLKQLDFRSRLGLSVLAIYRGGHSIATDLRHLPLRLADVLLLQGRPEDLQRLQERRDLWLLNEVSHLPFRRRRAITSAAALAGAVLLAGLGLMPISIAFLLAAITVVVSGCIEAGEVYDLIEWRLLVLIGGMTAFGLAMTKSNAAPFLAQTLVGWVLPLGLTAVLATLALLTILLTQPLSNAAAVLIMIPLAVSTATELGVDPRPLAVLVTLSASLSFITPFEPACLLVYAPGGYGFRDFLRSGAPLTLLTLILLLILVPIIWPL